MTANTAQQQNLMREYERLADVVIAAVAQDQHTLAMQRLRTRAAIRRTLVEGHGMNPADFAAGEQQLNADVKAAWDVRKAEKRQNTSTQDAVRRGEDGR